MTLTSITKLTHLVVFPAPNTRAELPRLDHDYPREAAGVPPGVHRSGRYAVRFARNSDDLRAIQRLRFEVFNLELREGLTNSYKTGLDRDACLV